MDANTDLGQHFMTDTPLIERIVDCAELSSADMVLEIGPGLGALTSLLEKRPSSLITVDVDERFKADIHGNILDIIGTLSFNTLVSNLPYHICEPLFIKLAFLRPKKIVVVVGEQFAKHLLEETILGSVFADLYETKLVELINPESFSPPPRVMSALIRCDLKEKIGNLADFYSYPKSKVKNYFKTKTTKKEAQEFINKLPVLVAEKRLYELNKAEFLMMKKILQTM